MPLDQELARTPPTPRALRTVRGSRLELARLYIQAKAGEVDPQLAGKLAHILSILIRSSTDFALEERIAKLEAKVGAAKPNGHTRPGANL
jgi:hypothetical protein